MLSNHIMDSNAHRSNRIRKCTTQMRVPANHAHSRSRPHLRKATPCNNPSARFDRLLIWIDHSLIHDVPCLCRTCSRQWALPAAAGIGHVAAPHLRRSRRSIVAIVDWRPWPIKRAAGLCRCWSVRREFGRRSISPGISHASGAADAHTRPEAKGTSRTG
jgi:hypothetical protein